MLQGRAVIDRQSATWPPWLPLEVERPQEFVLLPPPQLQPSAFSVGDLSLELPAFLRVEQIDGMPGKRQVQTFLTRQLDQRVVLEMVASVEVTERAI